MKAKIIKNYNGTTEFVGEIGESKSLGFSAGIMSGRLEEVYSLTLDNGKVIRCFIGELEFME